MNKEKISSQEIIDLVASKASVSKRAAEEFLKVMIASVEEALLAGESVKIKNFGTFKLQWNEPRKSVNVQSGEEIMISGYYKVVFIPDALLKEQVNEPFAHLEPVELDTEANKNVIEANKNEIIAENEAGPDPLRLFTEQASEIKNLISEIQALSKNAKTSVFADKSELDSIIEEEAINEIDLNEPKKEVEKKELEIKLLDEAEPIISDSNQETSEELVESSVENNPFIAETDEPQLSTELPVTPFLDDIKPVKKHKVRNWFLLIFIFLIVLGTGFYFIYLPTTKNPDRYTLSNIFEKFSITDIANSVSGWFEPVAKKVPIPEIVVIPKDTVGYDSISQNQPIDSLQLLFDSPRVYNDFITSVRIQSGSRLTNISKRYYGAKDFWVYIYEANKDRISNPDNISTGTLIKIPKLDSRLIDLNNPRCLQKAKELHDIYIK
jgi:nucleoid DNA-binding protein/nucleoid-associated protein YgaU